MAVINEQDVKAKSAEHFATLSLAIHYSTLLPIILTIQMLDWEYVRNSVYAALPTVKYTFNASSVGF